MDTPNAKEYALTFESYGLTFALGEIGILDYMPAESMIIGQRGKHSEFMSAEHTLAAMDREGVEFFSTIGPIRASAKRLDGLFAQMNETLLQFKNPGAVDKESMRQVYELMGKIQDEYRHFGHGYTDTVFLESETDPAKREALEFVAAHKNDIRVQYDKVVFNADGGIPTILNKIGQQFGISAEELTWYLQKEILDLFRGKAMDRLHIEARKLAYVFYKTVPGRDYVFYEGRDAEKFIEEFGAFKTPEGVREVKGRTANKGPVVRGVARIINSNYSDPGSVEKKMSDMQQGDILIATVTAPDLMTACRKAAAIVTDVGGLLSHGAIISRELGIPSIVDTQIGSKVFKDGDMVEVDAERGIVRKI
ncbi:MAG: PEP-utilizing enzyme [Patescibacteria group bacterium]